MVKRGRFVGHSVDRFRYNRPLREGAKAVGSYCRAVAIVPFDRNRSVSRVLEISLVPDGSRNGSDPDLSVVVFNGLTLRHGLVLRRSQDTTLLPTALLGHAGGNVLHTGASFLFSQATETPYVESMLKMGDNSCIG